VYFGNRKGRTYGLAASSAVWARRELKGEPLSSTSTMRLPVLLARRTSRSSNGRKSAVVALLGWWVKRNCRVGKRMAPQTATRRFRPGVRIHRRRPRRRHIEETTGNNSNRVASAYHSSKSASGQQAALWSSRRRRAARSFFRSSCTTRGCRWTTTSGRWSSARRTAPVRPGGACLGDSHRRGLSAWAGREQRLQRRGSVASDPSGMTAAATRRYLGRGLGRGERPGVSVGRCATPAGGRR
jgi:hypothetical protein